MLKKLLKSMLGNLAEATKLLAEGKQAEAIEKMNSINKDAEGVDLDKLEDEPAGEEKPAGEEAPAGDTPPSDTPPEAPAGEEIEKFTKEEMTNLKKRASLNVDAVDMPTLLGYLKEFISFANDGGITKAQDAITKSVEIEKKLTEIEKIPLVKQAQEDGGDKEVKKSVFDGMITSAPVKE